MQPQLQYTPLHISSKTTRVLTCVGALRTLVCTGQCVHCWDNLFIYQARAEPGPSRVSDSPVSAETVIYEAFVLIGEIGYCLSLLISWSNGNVWRLEFCRKDLSPLFLFSMQSMQRNTTSVLPLQQRLHKLHFLQKLGCQKHKTRLEHLTVEEHGESVRRPLGPVTVAFIREDDLVTTGQGSALQPAIHSMSTQDWFRLKQKILYISFNSGHSD